MRSDILKELELLPLWQLRHPLPVDNQVANAIQIETVEVAEPQHADLPPKAQEASEPTDDAATELSVVCYQNANNGFVLLHATDAITAGAQRRLLQNIASSLPFNLMAEKAPLTIKEVLQNHTPKTLVLMGESLAQQVLDVSDDLSALRGKVQMLAETQVVVSFELSEVLGAPEMKKQLWQDCCLALSTLSAPS